MSNIIVATKIVVNDLQKGFNESKINRRCWVSKAVFIDLAKNGFFYSKTYVYACKHMRNLSEEKI